MSPAARSLILPAVLVALAAAFLAGLGNWQVRRLGEKEALIARVETRLRAEPTAPPARAAWGALVPADYDYTPVRARGRFAGGREAFIFTKAPEGFGLEPGYIVLTPFTFADGGTVLVERGFLPASRLSDDAGRAPPQGEAEIAGLMRAPQTRNPFTPADTPDKGVWFTRDPVAIASNLGLADAAPFTLALQSPSAAGPNGFPRLAPVAPEFANNHLSYAITWFSLWAALLVVFALFARARLTRGA
jgi:surfeit locus 1 family protein